MTLLTICFIIVLSPFVAWGALIFITIWWGLWSDFIELVKECAQK